MTNVKAKILLVEDEASIRYVAQRQFRALGYPLSDTAEDGLIAVQKALETDYDLIFMDVRLPVLDGLAATRRIREAGKNTVIIGMTAFMHRDECIQAGMNDFLQKPVMLGQLGEVVEKWLKEQSMNPVVVVDIPKPEKFIQTEQRLSQLRAKIEELRKRSLND